jgi:hypothetical protein
VVDSVGGDTEVSGNVFLRAIRLFIRAPRLVAGGNYWGTASEAAAAGKIQGAVTITPWHSASEAGY